MCSVILIFLFVENWLNRTTNTWYEGYLQQQTYIYIYKIFAICLVNIRFMFGFSRDHLNPYIVFISFAELLKIECKLMWNWMAIYLVWLIRKPPPPKWEIRRKIERDLYIHFPVQLRSSASRPLSLCYREKAVVDHVIFIAIL